MNLGSFRQHTPESGPDYTTTNRDARERSVSWILSLPCPRNSWNALLSNDQLNSVYLRLTTVITLQYPHEKESRYSSILKEMGGVDEVSRITIRSANLFSLFP